MWIITSWVIFAAAAAWPMWFAGRRLVRRIRRRRRCEMCAYDLRGSVTERCAECGHDLTKPLRLIRVRAALLHGTIMVCLLTASHLVNRIEAIQKRGWIAAVPTTVLIECLPYQDSDPEAFGLMWRLSDELALRRHGNGRDGDDATRVPSDELARWQRRLMIHKAVNVRFGPGVPWSNWQYEAEQIIRDESVRLTAAQIEKVQSLWYFEAESRPAWPLEGVVYARFRFDCITVDRVRFRALPLTEGYNAFGERITEGIVPLGVARHPGPVDYELVVERVDRESREWRTVSRRRVTIAVVSESAEPGLDAVTLSDEVLATLSPTLDPVRGPFDGFGICFDVFGDPSLERLLGDGTLALSIELLCDGEPFATSKERWHFPREREDRSAHSDRRWHVDLQAHSRNAVEEVDRPWNHEWTVIINGDPILALCDFESTSYWAGRHEFRNIPVERVQP